jgi:hypothetical protein
MLNGEGLQGVRRLQYMQTFIFFLMDSAICPSLMDIGYKLCYLDGYYHLTPKMAIYTLNKKGFYPQERN